MSWEEFFLPVGVHDLFYLLFASLPGRFAPFCRCCFAATSLTATSWVFVVSLFISSFFFFVFVLFVFFLISSRGVFFLRKRDALRRLSKCACRDRVLFTEFPCRSFARPPTAQGVKTVSKQITRICNYSLAQALHVASKFPYGATSMDAWRRAKW